MYVHMYLPTHTHIQYSYDTHMYNSFHLLYSGNIFDFNSFSLCNLRLVLNRMKFGSRRTIQYNMNTQIVLIVAGAYHYQ